MTTACWRMNWANECLTVLVPRAGARERVDVPLPELLAFQRRGMAREVVAQGIELPGGSRAAEAVGFRHTEDRRARCVPYARPALCEVRHHFSDRGVQVSVDLRSLLADRRVPSLQHGLRPTANIETPPHCGRSPRLLSCPARQHVLSE